MKGPVLLHDNARPHVAQSTLLMLNELGYDTLSHPAYSTELSPASYYLIKRFENFLHDKCSKNKDEAKNAFNAFVASTGKDFYSSAIYTIISRCQKYVDCNGPYFD